MTPRIAAVAAVSLVLVPGASWSADHASYHITGTHGEDRLVGTPQRNWMEGFGGDDRIFGRGGNDLIGGGKGDDRLLGGVGNDDLGDDKGSDTLVGGPGKDSLDGGRDLDVLKGGKGNDFLADYDGGDIVRGGAGRDHAAMGQDEKHQMPATEVYMGPGNDYVTENDDNKQDFIDCGPGQDRVEWVTTQDELDVIVNCEVITEYLGP